MAGSQKTVWEGQTSPMLLLSSISNIWWFSISQLFVDFLPLWVWKPCSGTALRDATSAFQMLLSSSVGSDVCMGLPRKPFKGREESGHDEGSWAALGRWRDLLEGWWLRRSGEFLACIRHLFSHTSCPGIWREIHICVYISLYLLVYEFHLCSWHQYMVQVPSFEGCIWLKRWPIQPRKIFLCLAGWGQCWLHWMLWGSVVIFWQGLSCMMCPATICCQQPLTSLFVPPGKTWPKELRGFVCLQCNHTLLCGHQRSFICLHRVSLSLVCVPQSTRPVEDA